MKPVTAADTTPEAAKAMWAVLRRLDPAERARQSFELSDELWRTVEAGVRQRHPEYDAERVRLTTVRLWLGDELFRRVHPDIGIDV